MRWLSSALLLALLAALTALFLKTNLGNVAFFVAPYRVDVSVNLALVVLILLLSGVYWAARVVQKMADFPEQVRLYRARREEIGGNRALIESLKNFLEGRFARAEKSARAAQSTSSTAGIAALVGARAAHRMQEYGRRDEWLELAGLDTDVDTARLVASAEMLTEQRENDAALSAIHSLQGEGRRHIHAMRIALNANLQSERWDDALKALRLLEKRNALHPVLARRLKCTIYRELLTAHSADPAALEAVWRAIPDADRQSIEVAIEGARLFNEAGLGALAVEAIENVLRDSPAEWDDSARTLLEEYGRAKGSSPREQLERVEAWLKDAPFAAAIRAALLHAAGAICWQQQLWGKSKAYLLESLAADRTAATLLALARLADAIGDEREAASYFKEAALAFAAEPKSNADTPAAVLRAAQR
ncbi:MAG TPA: heme biosynthesis HemY N-terminal domain-containing protein [Burkholderiaceae bacterium]|nr:heme biosynthesis HemY N-terminal domain-containing protein [Burkholderiaceae bacterium]